MLEGSDTCPNCGCPVENCDLSGEEESPQKVEIAAVSLPKSLSKLKRGMLRNIVIGVVAVILIIIIAVTTLNLVIVQIFRQRLARCCLEPQMQSVLET